MRAIQLALALVRPVRFELGGLRGGINGGNFGYIGVVKRQNQFSVRFLSVEINFFEQY